MFGKKKDDSLKQEIASLRSENESLKLSVSRLEEMKSLMEQEIECYRKQTEKSEFNATIEKGRRITAENERNAAAAERDRVIAAIRAISLN